MRKLLGSRCYPFGLCDMGTLDKILYSLSELGWIKRERVHRGSNWDWQVTLAGEPLDEYIKWRDRQ